jgi:hypothetical protein
MLGFGAAGGVGSYFLFFGQDADSSPEPPLRAAALDDAPSSESDVPTTTEPDRDAEVAASHDTATGARPDDSASGVAVSGSPEAVLARHYELIDQGDYHGAWRLFHPDYRNGPGARWVQTKEEELPRIDIESLEITRGGPLGPGLVRLDIELVAADTAGESARVCRRFVGWSRMKRIGGEWRYRPGEVDGEKPGLELRPISDTDPRCARVLG